MNAVNRNHRLHSLITDVLKRASLEVPSIQKQHRNVNLSKLITNHTLVLIDFGTFRKVKQDILRLNPRSFLLDLGDGSLNFLLIATDNADIEALGSKLVANLKANSIGPASHDRIRTFALRSVFGVQVLIAP